MIGTKEKVEPASSGLPGVCVIVPNFNYGSFLPEAIGSIAAQTLPPRQLIVYDDGSNDDSVDAARRALARHGATIPETVLVASSQNGGKLHALNTVIPMVSEPVTVILDSDDLIAPSFLEVLVGALVEACKTDPDIGFAYCDCDLLDNAGDLVAPGNSEAFDSERLQVASYIPDCAPTLTSKLVAALPFDTSIRVATKHHKWLRIVGAGVRGLHVPERLFGYRMHDTNMSGIGARIRADIASGARGERILSNYWQSVSIRNEN